jgi:hypothetical protein
LPALSGGRWVGAGAAWGGGAGARAGAWAIAGAQNPSSTPASAMAVPPAETVFMIMA